MKRNNNRHLTWVSTHSLDLWAKCLIKVQKRKINCWGGILLVWKYVSNFIKECVKMNPYCFISYRNALGYCKKNDHMLSKDKNIILSFMQLFMRQFIFVQFYIENQTFFACIFFFKKFRNRFCFDINYAKYLRFNMSCMSKYNLKYLMKVNFLFTISMF